MIRIYAIAIVLVLFISCKNSTSVLPDVEQAELKNLVQAYALYSKKDWSRSLEITELFLKKHPKYFTAYLLESKILYFSEQQDLAIEKLEKLTKKYPDYYEAHFWLAKFYYTSGYLDKAQDKLEYLMRINTQDHNAIYLSSLIDIQNESLDTALNKLYTASIAREDIALVYYEMGNIFLEIGAIDKAEEQLRKGRTLVDKDDLLYEKITITLDVIKGREK